MITKKVYFTNLNTLRFLAAFMVIVHHVEQFKSIFGLPSLWTAKSKLATVIHLIGPQGVILFFVLSGFLITYLLLAEETKTNTIAIKKFYMRRILRIWPLYLLIIALSLFILPHLSFFELPDYPIKTVQSNLGLKVFLYLFFFANLVLALLGFVPYASQTWSIGTEEQFYLVWPIIVKYIKKNRYLLFIGIIIIYHALKIFIYSDYSYFIPYLEIIKAFWDGFAIDNMAIGALFAFILYKKDKILELLYHPLFHILSITIFVILYVNPHSFEHIQSLKYPFLYGILIINLASNTKHTGILESKPTNYLGQISYGLYMFHPIAITIAIKFAMYTGVNSNILIYLISIVLSVGISSFSYNYFESYFLKYKNRYAIIKSGK